MDIYQDGSDICSRELSEVDCKCRETWPEEGYDPTMLEGGGEIFKDHAREM